MYTDIFGFGACAAVIIYIGTKLSFYGDKIAAHATATPKQWQEPNPPRSFQF